jgi:hypothetical protein
MEQGAAVSQAPVAKRRSPGDEPPAMNAGRWTPGAERRGTTVADGRREAWQETAGGVWADGPFDFWQLAKIRMAQDFERGQGIRSQTVVASR